jgi:Leucine-rich repeat (LRR) protein
MNEQFFDIWLQLEDVPRFLYRMTNLTDMRFSNCRLQNVAVELCRLKSLTNLNLNGNDFILFPPVECVASGFARVMNLLKV